MHCCCYPALLCRHLLELFARLTLAQHLLCQLVLSLHNCSRSSQNPNSDVSTCLRPPTAGASAAPTWEAAS
jgi:hypothetical protein